MPSLTTIAAICTPPGDGGVAMIRLSGPDAISIASNVFSKDLQDQKSHHMLYGSFLNAHREVVDSGLLVIMRAPHSYTGEDVVELFCHGGRLITQKVLQCTLASGAEPAGPGAFTERAFLNQKIDLTQAEAVQALISAQNEAALKMASAQLEGQLSQKILHLQNKLTHQAAILEAWVDFPEEGLEFCTIDEIQMHLQNVLNEMLQMLSTFEDGQILKEGFSICLLGKPNVGKSSLLNQLLKKERAIVTPIAGTTRDLIEDTFVMDGMQYHVMDTAGIRQTDEIIEKEGIERALKAASKADLILYMLDSSQELDSEDLEIMGKVKDQNVLYVLNKTDLGQQLILDVQDKVSISAKSGFNLDQLFLMIKKLTTQKVFHKDQIYLTERRHQKALEKAAKHLTCVLEGLKDSSSPEWLSFDLKASLKALSEMIGFDVTESILSDIFKNFCIGK